MPLDSTNWPASDVGVTTADETTALLIRARGLVERGWCRNMLARNAEGIAIHPTSTTAGAWCALGALVAAGVPEKAGVWQLHPATRRLQTAIGGYRGISHFNDGQRTVHPVLAAFDRAIAAGSR